MNHHFGTVKVFSLGDPHRPISSKTWPAREPTGNDPLWPRLQKRKDCPSKYDAFSPACDAERGAANTKGTTAAKMQVNSMFRPGNIQDHSLVTIYKRVNAGARDAANPKPSDQQKKTFEQHFQNRHLGRIIAAVSILSC